MKKLHTFIFLPFAVLLLGGCAPSNGNTISSESITIPTSQVVRKEAQNDSGLQEKDAIIHPVSIPALMEKEFDGRELQLGTVLASNESYTRHAITYKSGELTISGIMNIPVGDGPFPLLVLNHGYIDPAVYTRGRGLKREQDYLAKKGYAVLHTDYRNHALSDKDEETETTFRLGYAEDAINAVLAVQKANLPSIDAEHVGMLGHSMGGGVTLNTLVIKPGLVDAAVLFAPVSTDARRNFERWTERRPERAQRIREEYGDPVSDPAFWENVSASTFYDRIEAPVMVHHGTADDSVPLEWSEELERDLEAAGKDVTFHIYENAPHEFIRYWNQVMERTVAFFDEHLKERSASGNDTEEKAPFTEVVAQNLLIPWSIAFLPSGDLLVTERSGTLVRISDTDRIRHSIQGVRHAGEGGLLGITLHPDFKETRWIYLYLTSTEGGVSNRVERYRFEDDELSDRTVIFSGIPGAVYHDGGFIGFGPDGYLYVTTGDAGNGLLAQDIQSFAGKILRLRDDGTIPADNPFGNAVYSYGHRNSQGLAWDDQGRLWSTEHGRSGILSGFDELNLIEKGKNYGWPLIQGGEKKGGMEMPVLHSGADDTWAPASAAFFDGSIFFGGLRGEALYEAVIGGDVETTSLRTHFLHEFGRIRAVTVGPDEFLYITTSNTDGRGDPVPNDDRIMRINSQQFR
jgi:glucose/arabinose dehydrogenase/dienelactone hydrolase